MQIRRLLDNWLGWILLIVVLRLGFSLLEQPPISPQKQSFHTLINIVRDAKTQEEQTIALKALQKSIQIYPQHKKYILQALKQYSSIPQIKTFLQERQLDALSIINKATEFSVPLMFYLEPVAVLLPLLWGIFFLIVIPILLHFFVGHRALNKTFGHRGKYYFLAGDLCLWGAIIAIYHWQQKIPLMAQIALILYSALMLWQMQRSQLLGVVLGISEAYIKQGLIVITVALLASLVPSFLPTAKIEPQVSEAQLLQALKLIKKPYKAVQPPLIKLLSYHPYSTKVTCKIIETLGKIGDEKLFATFNIYLNNPDPRIKKAALKAIFHILEKQPRK